MILLLIVLGLMVVLGVGLGFYLGWFKMSSRTGTSKPNITLTVDKDKILADKDQAVDRLHDLGHHAKDKVGATPPKAAE
jgi:hypothetical protein